MKFKNILLTGATGVVGQHVLFELLRHFEQNDIDGKIYLVVRSSGSQTSKDRIASLLANEYVPSFIREYPLTDLLNRIEVFDADLTSPSIKKIFSFQKEHEVCVIHCAASTNLLPTDEAEKEIKFANYHASINLLNACVGFAKKFVFISTAFSCGVRKGFVDEDYLGYPQDNFRNPYEKYKSLAESEIVSICDLNKVAVQILRPSIVCGRLLDASLYYTPKFDVFYGYTKFFYKLMETPFAKSRLRILAAPERAVSNVIPVDYVAKAIAAAISRDDIIQMNIAHSHSVPLSFSLAKMVELNGFKNYSIVDKVPEDMNMLEALYYSEVGAITSPYLYDDPFEFDSKTVRELLGNIPEPDIKSNTDAILQYAKEKQFINA